MADTSSDEPPKSISVVSVWFATPLFNATVACAKTAPVDFSRSDIRSTMSSANPELYPSDIVMLPASESSTVGQSLISMKSGTVTMLSVKVADVVPVLVMLVDALGVVDGLDVIELV